MPARIPFTRPIFALGFYVLACLIAVYALFLGFLMIVGGIGMLGRAWAGLVAAYGVVMVFICFIQAAFCGAIGYVIELIAKIEWNTRQTDQPAYFGARQYFYRENGKENGPFSAPDMLNLYRDGKLSNSAQLIVEEHGQRRPLRNMSDIGL